jgi:hypothetical protein
MPRIAPLWAPMVVVGFARNQCRNYKIEGPCVVIILGPFLGFIFVVHLIYKYQIF